VELVYIGDLSHIGHIFGPAFSVIDDGTETRCLWLTTRGHFWRVRLTL